MVDPVVVEAVESAYAALLLAQVGIDEQATISSLAAVNMLAARRSPLTEVVAMIAAERERHEGCRPLDEHLQVIRGLLDDLATVETSN